MLERFISSNSLAARLLLTVLEGVVAVAVVAVPLAVGWLDLSPEAASVVTAAIVAVLSPCLALLRTGNPEDGLKDGKE